MFLCTSIPWHHITPIAVVGRDPVTSCAVVVSMTAPVMKRRDTLKAKWNSRCVNGVSKYSRQRRYSTGGQSSARDPIADGFG